MMKKDRWKNIALTSMGRCSKKGLKKDIKEPQIILEEKELNKEIERKNSLISAFNNSYEEIESFLKSQCLFLS